MGATYDQPMNESPQLSEGADVSGNGKSVKDGRPRALGLGRLVMAMFWVLGAWVLATAIVDLFHHQNTLPWGPQIVALIAGIVYFVGAAGLTHNGRRMRIIAGYSIGISIAAPIIIGIAGFDVPDLIVARSAWNRWGADFYYLPLIISMIGTGWMWRSNPRRIVELAERVERPRS